jgi:Xaa-Pro aminopeptidase
VSSGDLVQHFLCRFSAAELAAHERAAVAIAEVKEDALHFVAEEARGGRGLLETDLVARIERALADRGLDSGGPPIVASGTNTASPHHASPPETARAIRENDLLFLDLSGREHGPDGVFAELCWVACVSKAPEDKHARAFAAVAEARDRAIELVASRTSAGRRVLGFEVDRAAREVLAAHGLLARFLHRTGHHLGRAMNSGDGATLDDLEIHDTRELVPGLAWSIHPGVYFDSFGLRTGVSVVLEASGPRTTTPIQKEIEALLA